MFCIKRIFGSLKLYLIWSSGKKVARSARNDGLLGRLSKLTKYLLSPSNFGRCVLITKLWSKGPLNFLIFSQFGFKFLPRADEYCPSMTDTNQDKRLHFLAGLDKTELCGFPHLVQLCIALWVNMTFFWRLIVLVHCGPGTALCQVWNRSW